MFAKVFTFLLPALASAQTYSLAQSPAVSTTTSSAAGIAPSAPPSQININVAPYGNYSFGNSASITVLPGTIVTFYFPSGPPNHSVTQSSFSNPCTPLAGGFDSSLTSASIFSIVVTDSKPIWYFCNHPLHCYLGMVGSINAPATGETFSAFQAAALSLASSVASGIVTVTNSGPVNGGIDASATGPPVSDLTAIPTAAAAAASSAIKVTTSIGFVLFATILCIAVA